MNADVPRSITNGFSVAITGSGGSGAVTTGLILLEVAVKTGYYGLMTRSYGAQIRGGESASLLRFGHAPVACMNDRFDLLVGLDWRNAGRFAQEIPLGVSSLILADPAVGRVPESFSASGASIRELAFKERAATVEGGRLNMVAVGAAGALCGLRQETMEAAVHAILADKGADMVGPAVASVALGYELAAARELHALATAQKPPARWNISGNEACGLGALRGGVRFVAAYPITPASDILEWLAPRLERLGGSLVAHLRSIRCIRDGTRSLVSRPSE